MAYLVESKKQSGTITSYLSAIKAVLQDQGIVLDIDAYLLNSLTRACHLKNDQIRHQLPMQKSMLSVLLQRLGKTFVTQPYLLVLFRALLSTTYFGLFRISELTYTTSSHNVKARDVHIANNKKKILFILRSLKTHGPWMKPQKIKITTSPATQSNQQQLQPGRTMKDSVLYFCPYRLLRNYLAVRGGYLHEAEPFFIYSDHSPVPASHFRKCLKQVIADAGFNNSLYGSHSLRSGRAGASVETIKQIGRWKSNAVFRYLKN